MARFLFCMWRWEKGKKLEQYRKPAQTGLEMREKEKYWYSIRSYIIMIVACILLLFAKAHVISLLDIVVGWLSSCSKEWFAVLVSALCLSLSFVIILKIKEKEQKVANSTFAAALFAILFYTYFRFINHTYACWGIGWYKWTDILYFPFVLFAVQMIVCNRQILS